MLLYGSIVFYAVSSRIHLSGGQQTPHANVFATARYELGHVRTYHTYVCLPDSRSVGGLSSD